MSSEHRDSLDTRLGGLLRAARPIRPQRPLPEPRGDEPADDELLLYVDGDLSPEDAGRFEARLTHYPFSADRVEILREALKECGFYAVAEEEKTQATEAEEKSGQVARLIFAITAGKQKLLTFLRGTDDPTFLPQVALATRGSGEPTRESYLYELRKRFDDCDVLVQVDALGEAVELKLALEVDGEPLDDGRATLKRRGRLERSLRIRDGHAEFGDLTPDNYCIELRRNGTVLGQLELAFLRAY